MDSDHVWTQRSRVCQVISEPSEWKLPQFVKHQLMARGALFLPCLLLLLSLLLIDVVVVDVGLVVVVLLCLLLLLLLNGQFSLAPYGTFPPRRVACMGPEVAFDV
ncbi:unnamed protein product, partial [Polarella glacialis]